MGAMRLTKKIVVAAEAGERDVFLWDSEIKGFGLRVWPSGRKTFIAKYRVGGGRSAATKRFTIGTFGVLTVEDARVAARRVLAEVTHGEDPAGRRQAKRKELTVAELIDLYAEKGTDHLKDRNKRWMLARLRHHVVPLLGRKKITDVRVADVEQFMRDVKAGKTAKDEKTGPRVRVIVKGGAGAAVKGVRDLSAVFAFAVRQELVPSNPCAPVKKPADGKRLRFLTLDEVRRLGEALDDLEAEGASPKAIAIMRLWALTGCRRDEIAALKWSEVDFDHACLRLTDTKTGRSVRPLASAAVALLRALSDKPLGVSDTLSPASDGRAAAPDAVMTYDKSASDYVFPSDDGQSYYQGTKRIWPKVIGRANLPGVTPHTLRHTIGSAAVSSGETLAMTGALLGHTNARSTSIYAHMQQDPARRAADRVVGPIATALGARKEAEVVSFSAKKIV